MYTLGFSLWDWTEGSLQLRLGSCMGFLPCRILFPSSLLSWNLFHNLSLEQESSSQAMLLEYLPKTAITFLNSKSIFLPLWLFLFMVSCSFYLNVIFLKACSVSCSIFIFFLSICFGVSFTRKAFLKCLVTFVYPLLFKVVTPKNVVWELCVDGGLVFGGQHLYEILMVTGLSLDMLSILPFEWYSFSGEVFPSLFPRLCKFGCLHQWGKGLQSHSVGSLHFIPLFQSNHSSLLILSLIYLPPKLL